MHAPKGMGVFGDKLYVTDIDRVFEIDITKGEIASRYPAEGSQFLNDISIDKSGNIYISDMENSAVHVIGQDRTLTTLLKDPAFRWPDGFSFGPDGWLYFTCSSLMDVIGKSDAHIKSQAPYQIYRFQPGTNSIPGH